MTQQTFTDFAAPYPVEVQLKSAIELMEFHRARADAAEKRRVPPERKELEELQRKLEQAQRAIESERQNAAVWKQVAGEMSDRIDAIKDGTDTARLERERDHWKALWRNATSRLAELLEHQGNIELLERQRDELERQLIAFRSAR